MEHSHHHEHIFRTEWNDVVFKPRRRVFWDVFLFINVLFVMSYPLCSCNGFFLVLLVLIANVVWLICWLLWVRPFFLIKILNQRLIGPGPGFKRVEISLMQIDPIRIRERMPWEKMLSVYSIWSLGGDRLFLFKRLIGRRSTSRIMAQIEHFTSQRPDKHTSPGN